MKLWTSRLLMLICGLSLVLSAEAFAQKKKKKKGMKKKKVDAGEMTEQGGEDAGSDAAAGGYQKPYGMAGCGLGAMVLGGDGNQIMIATTNATSASQTFGITTGTSNCTDTPAEVAALEQQVFIEANLASLSKEAASGGGETLDSFAEVLGCEVGDRDYFASLSQLNHAKIFSQSEPLVILQHYKELVGSDEKLGRSCIRAT